VNFRQQLRRCLLSNVDNRSRHSQIDVSVASKVWQHLSVPVVVSYVDTTGRHWSASVAWLLQKLPPVSETRVSPLFEVRVPPVLIEARAASCPRPACLRFSRSLYLRLGFSYLQPKRAYELPYKYYIYNSHSSKNSRTLLLLQLFIIVYLLYYYNNNATYCYLLFTA